MCADFSVKITPYFYIFMLEIPVQKRYPRELPSLTVKDYALGIFWLEASNLFVISCHWIPGIFHLY
jgi:hypothetical protein